jgi:hypothetical protein
MRVQYEYESAVHTTSSDDHNVIASERALLATAYVDDRGQQHRGRNVAGVATAFSALSTDDVHASSEGLGYVLWVADHCSRER